MGVMNRKKVESNPSKILESSTQKAFAALKHPEISSPDEVKRALLELTKPLKGIGPATASAVLAVYSETIPFMSDEAVLSLITKKGSNLHDMNNYLAYYARVCELVTELNSTTGEGDPIQWNARNVERALWTARMDEVLGLGLLNLYLEQNEQKESAQEKIVDPDDDDKLDSQNLKGKKPEKRNLERSEESFGDDGSEKKLKRDNDTEDDKK
ncbi:hypothetical protein HK098_005684 [Nowakowskiella sp. JEL0407]|nr:hypothetical protein HK098_005684 [Nowakowskiella sp. JEL0407]